jgi:hypothetical protein
MIHLPTRSERRAMRAELRAKQKATKADMKSKVRELKRNPEVMRAMNRRRRRLLVRILLVVILIWLLLQLDCSGDPVTDLPPVNEITTEQVDVVPKKIPKRKQRRKLAGKVKSEPRGKLALEVPPVPPWLDAFRLQVAARSPRLARCFEGNERPGAMRLSALVNAGSGRISEPVVEPAFRGTDLTSTQEKCLVRVLAGQPYQLVAVAPEAASRRVSLIFEF